MAELNPPFVLNNAGATHPHDLFREVLKALRGQQGVVATGDLLVSALGTPNMTVNVAAGKAIIDGTQVPLTQGSYLVRNDAIVNKAIAAADPTNPRNDLVVAQVQDDFYSGAVHAWQLAVITGTPAPSPADPAIPANSLVLARVRVDAGVGTIVSGKITDLRPQGSILNAALAPSGYRVADGAAAIGASALAARADHQHPAVGLGGVWTRIDSGVLGAAAASITISSLPTSGYSHARLLLHGRGDAAGSLLDVQVKFNNDGGNNYGRQFAIFGNAYSGSATDATAPNCLGITGTTAPANSWGDGEVIIWNYRSALHKVAIAEFVQRESVGGIRIQRTGLVWQNTAVVTSLVLVPSAGNFAAGTSWELWAA